MGPAKTTAKAPSLRDKHKSQTARALRAAALTLFATQGYDATTTEEIAEKAGVSPRTFFRYFPTKESLLYTGENDWIRSFADELPNQPTRLSDLDAACQTILSYVPWLEHRRQSLLLFIRSIASSRTLRGLDSDHQRENTALVSAAFATRRGQATADEACIVLASITLLAYRRALELWLNESTTDDLATIIAAEFGVVTHVLTN